MLSDEALAAAVIQGETEKFEELMRRYQTPVFAIIYRMCRHYQDTEDIAQEVFLNVYQKMYQFDVERKFSSWLYRIAINTCITVMRKKNKVVNINFDETYIQGQLDLAVPDHENPEKLLENQELRANIKAALEKLRPTYKVIIILRYQMDFSNGEIAEILGVTRENVEVRIHRAREALRQIIIKQWSERGQAHELPASK